jgi:hypothetical protein
MGLGRAVVMEGGAGCPSRVSVIVPTRNAAGSLRHLLEALSAQTYQDFEVVVVDDGSTDDTAEVVRNAVDGGSTIRYVPGKKAGAVAARCAGIEQATGEILAFTDSDCIPDSRWLAQGVASVDAGADVVQGKTVPQRGVGPLERSISYTSYNGLFATCNVLYRRSAFEASGGFDRAVTARLGFRPTARARGLGFGEDTLVGWATARSGSSAYVAEAVVRHDVKRTTAAEAISRAWMAGAFPSLTKEVPELRLTLLRHGPFLGGLSVRHLTYAFAVSAASIFAAPAPAGVVTVALGTCWMGSRARRAVRAVGSLRDRSLSFVLDLATDVVVSAALVAGSVRARKLVL